MSQVIHIIDTDAAARNSLAFLLVTAGYAVRTHDSGRSFLGELDGAIPACLITDMCLPDVSGLDLIKEVKARDNATPVIVVSEQGKVSKAVEAMKAGAADFLEKPFQDQRMLQAVENACTPAKTHDEAPSHEDIRKRLQALTTRERQVLDAIVDGLSNKLIAHRLDISPRTVEIHRANLMSKLRIRNLPQLVRLMVAVSEN